MTLKPLLLSSSRSALRSKTLATGIVAAFLWMGPGCVDGQEPDSGVLEDAGPGLDAGAPVDAGETDAGEGPTDSGPGPKDDAGPPDAGPPDAGPIDAGAPDAGEVDAGTPVDAGPAPTDEAGGLEGPLPVSLPFEITVDLDPAGDYDCFSFSTETGGRVIAATDGPNTCSGLDTRIRLYAAGETDVNSYIYDDDDDGPGPCSMIDEELGAGDFVVCARAYGASTVLRNVDVTISFDAYECGDGTIQPGEECDATPGCAANCLIDDGLVRENEAAGNGSPTGTGVLDLVLDEVVRGRVFGQDEDWWRLVLPGGLTPGAVRFSLGGIDADANGCGDTLGLKGDIFTLDDLVVPNKSTTSGPPCQVGTLESIAGDVIFGNETIYFRVRTTSSGGSYTLKALYIPQICGNGQLEPSEECEPNTPTDPLNAFCSPATCRYLPPENDSCVSATEVTLADDGTTTSLFGVNTTASNRISPSCRGTVGATGGRDTFFQFTAPATGTVAADLFTTGWTNGVVSAHTGGCNSLTETACNRATQRPSIEFSVTAGEIYTVSVDTTTTGGSYELRMGYLIPPANDVCANAIDITNALTLDAEPATFVGDTRAAADDTLSTLSGCHVTSPGVGRDVFYSFVAAQTGRIRIAVDSVGWNAVAYLMEGTCGTNVVCSDGPEVEGIVTEGETYTIAVDAENADVGPFSMSVRYIPVPTNNLCVDAEDVPLPPEGGTVSVSGDTTGSTDVLDATCSQGSATATRDTFYSFTAPGNGIVQFDLDASFDSVLVASADCSFTVEDICADGDKGEVTVTTGEVVIVAVDSWANSGFGEYLLTATFSPTPENDLCANPTLVTPSITGEVLVVSGTTTAASDNYNSSCTTAATNTRDTFYDVVAPADGSLVFDLNASYDSVLVASSSCNVADEFFCADNDRGAVDVTAGEHVLVAVEGKTTGRGPYELLMAYAALPPNDVCNAATELTLAVDTPAVVQGTNAGATDTFSATCGSSSATATKDVFYRFTAVETGRVIVALETNYGADLAVVDACDATTSLACKASTSGTTQQVAFEVVSGNEYFIAIDAHTATQVGFYELTLVFLRTLAGGETCVDATPLNANFGSILSTLTGSANQYDPENLGDCTTYNAGGGEVVYSITLQPGQTLNVDYNAELSGNDESLYILDGCPPSANACVEGSDSTVGGGESVSYTYQGAAPKTFYIVVDEYGTAAGASGGDFEMNWEVTGP